ncbi:S1 family peptidase [Bdellovibrio sp. HCB185ZH]|uniref:S1 family peptidase n=1 Tax=Bdellovibrio sp. HCB185ZH TaxID=3394235 RepID=UPI0039A61172
MKKTMISSVSLFVGLALLNGCTASSESKENLVGECIPGIVGGYSTSKSDPLSKKVVMLIGSTVDSDGNPASSVCTGTPITDDVILTAAHCVKGNTEMKAYFVTDATCSSGFRLSKTGVAASSFAYDHNYRDSKYSGIKNDVALVRLKSKIPADYDISQLYMGDQLSSDTVTLVGYGKTSETKQDSAFLRSKLKSYSRDVRVSTETVTIQQQDGGLCSGDSGGPIFVEVNGEKQILAVTSYVSNMTESTICHGTATGMYSKSILPWIEKTLPSLQ